VLNAKQHAEEAKVVALAGHKGSVTVATNMAGRGTDIMLGGSVEFLADQELRKQGLDPVENQADYDAAWPAMVEKITAQVAAEHEEVKALGGLYVLGTERHESRRIDNQLRGRSGRQGDPGESRFYLSLEDDLLRLFNAAFVERVLVALRVPDDVPIENKSVTRSIQSAQGQVESQNFESRKNVLKYDDVMSRQREVIYAERREVLEGADLHEQIRTMIDEAVATYVVAATEGFPEEWDLDALWTALGTLYPISLRYQDLETEAGGRDALDRDELLATLQADAQKAYDAREAEVGDDVMRELERRVLLSVLDRKWREHLYEMDYLREGIGLRAYSQRDPLVEYQREGFDMFNAMKEGIREETVGFLFNLEVQRDDEVEEEVEIPEGMEIEPGHEGHAHAPILRPIGGAAADGAAEAAGDGHAPHFRAKGLEAPKTPQHLTYAGPTEQGEVELRGQTVTNADDPFAGVGRNDKCPCGSGKKYKMCHGKAGGAGPTGQAVRGG
jgi:preprotein translocase subunit SecA